MRRFVSFSCSRANSEFKIAFPKRIPKQSRAKRSSRARPLPSKTSKSNRASSSSRTKSPISSGGIPQSRGPMTTAEEDVAGEELEPLFDYKRVQPAVTFRLDDSDLEKADIFKHCNKRAKVDTKGKMVNKKGAAAVEKAEVVDVDEEDWLAPPPLPVSRPVTQENSALRELRLKKQEFANFGESADDILCKLEEAAKKEFGAKKQPEQIILDDASEPEAEKVRERIIISVQDKDGQQKIRIYKDDKFDKLFKAYAKKAKLNPSELTFVFDGDKIDPASTPEDLDLEDGDMIEVSHKRR